MKLSYGFMAIGAVLILSACSTNVSTTEEQVKDVVNTVQEKATEIKEEGQKITGSIKDVMRVGGAMKCTWEDGNTSGITYIDGEKMNSKVTNMPVGENGEMGDAYTISDGQWLYMWTSLSANGTKMKMDPSDMTDQVVADGSISDSGDVSTNKPEGLNNMNAEYNYDCTTWNPDASMFAPPANITFSDMSELLEQMGQSFDGGDMKQVCNMLSGQDKIDCEAQFE